MRIIIGKAAGFCFGVENAVTKAEEEAKKNKKISCLGELVHNTQVTDELAKKGIKFIDNIEQANKRVIIRSHGVEKQIYDKAKQLGIELVDLTCPKVLHIHKLAQEYSKKGYYIFLIGKKKHPEMIGTVSFCGDYYYVIEDESYINQAIEEFRKTNKEKLLIIAQTTYSLEKFEEIVDKIKENIKENNIEIKNTICNATKQRQEETEKLAKQVGTMIIVGGKHSSNSNKLYELAKKFGKNVMFVETEEELDIEKFDKESVVGIMAGASTPKKSIEKVVEKLTTIC